MAHLRIKQYDRQQASAVFTNNTTHTLEKKGLMAAAAVQALQQRLTANKPGSVVCGAVKARRACVVGIWGPSCHGSVRCSLLHGFAKTDTVCNRYVACTHARSSSVARPFTLSCI